MAINASDLPVALRARRGWNVLWTVEDWWSIWIGLGLVAAAVVIYRAGGSPGWLAISPPGKWHSLDALFAHLAKAWPQYAALCALWSGLFGAGARSLGLPLRKFVAAFSALFVLSITIYSLGQWDQAARYNLEPPLVAL